MSILMSDDINKYPSKLQMIRNLAKEMKEVYKRTKDNMPVFVTPEIADHRIIICSDCEFYTKTGRCSNCGCYMDKKVNLASANCPLNKWSDDD